MREDDKALFAVICMFVVIVGFLALSACTPIEDEMRDGCHSAMKRLCEDPRFTDTRQCRECAKNTSEN